jgi:hypothetical protein
MYGPGSGDRIDTTSGVDVDHDGHPDTVVLSFAAEPLLAVDLDRDGLADLLIRIDPDGTAHRTALDAADLARADPTPFPYIPDPLSLLNPLASDQDPAFGGMLPGLGLGGGPYVELTGLLPDHLEDILGPEPWY